MHLLTTAIGTKPTSQHVRGHGESWMVSGPPADGVRLPTIRASVRRDQNP